MWAPEIEITSESSDDFFSKTYRNQCTSLSQFQVGKQSVVWPISEIHKCLESKEKIHFSVESFIETHPSFKLSFSHGNKADLEHAQIEIVQTKSFSENTNIFVKCKITVVSAQKEYEPSQTDTFSFDSDAESVWHFPKLIEITHLEEGKYIHLDDTLYLSCQFSFTTEGDPVYHTEIPSYAYNAFEVEECARVTNLSSSISKLYLDNQFCDVTLQVDNETFLAHKVVLCAQSPVFCAMFKNDTKEKNTNVVEITDVDVDTMELMLNFLHSDILKEDLSTEDICKLYSAADKYQISHFKQKCTRLLLSGLSVAEVCKVLILADLHQDDFLMSCVHNFVKYHANEVFHSSQWEEFNNENPVLSGRIMFQVWKSI
ncbi:hypothetical protein JTE90_000018 [Oedothorax gibbosus]|uniref:BTB domain-containing protein n=1 Tax=Oedothorax gibbosus TaxID=931172 RepID=A0AAV6TK73_9ARAC|nr:hypothetical protein JTE90_000018 [Oedothorax gibbosus]